VGVQAVAAGGAAGVPEDLIATLSFADGSIGTIVYASRGDPSFPKERLEVVGGSRVGVLDDFKTLELVRRGKRQKVSGRKDKGHDAELQAFVQAVARSGVPAISLDSLARTTRATFAIERALRTGEAQRLSDQ
jgi:predicted dehydrogenase